MTDAGFFRGTSQDQDNRFSDKEKKLLKQMKFADNLTTKIEMNKVKLDVLKPWISKRISELLGMEDDVVVEFVINQLEAEKSPDARKIQINLTGFLNGKNARVFMGELWGMLISAQENPSGIPTSMVEAKKEEIRRRNEENERMHETIKRTVSRFTEKLKDESGDSRDKRSGSMDKEHSSRKHTDGDNHSKSYSEDSVQSKRNYRKRSLSRSPEPSHRRKSRSRSRERKSGRSHDDYRRDRDRDRRRRSRSPRYHRKSRSRSPHRRSHRSRSRSPHRSQRSPSPRSSRRLSPSDRNNRSDSNRNKNSSNSLVQRRSASPSRVHEQLDDGKGGSRSPSPKVAKLDVAEKPRQKLSPTNAEEFKKTSDDSDHSSSDVDTTKAANKGTPSASGDSDKGYHDTDKKKKKKKEKKHKKNKKHKKLKKGKEKDKKSEDESADENEEVADEDDNVKGRVSENIAKSFLKLVDSENPSSEDLEKRLREKALESMKKAAGAHR